MTTFYINVNLHNEHMFIILLASTEHMFILGNYMRGPYRKRRIHEPPNIKNFKPSGIPRKMLQTVTVTVDEYEAIRLADYHGLEHLQASEKMAISRPTFTRLIEKARHKIAEAIVDGKELVVEGGNIKFENARHRCRDCGDEQKSPINQNITDCPECGSKNVEDISQNFLKNEILIDQAKKNDYKKGNF